MKKLFILVLILCSGSFAFANPEQYSVSQSDMNRIICNKDVENVYFSDEKGLLVSVAGKDVYVKFPVKTIIKPDTQEQETTYSTSPSELFIVCGGVTHSIILTPTKSRAQTIKLEATDEDSSSDSKGKDEEETVSLLMKALIEDNVPKAFKMKKINRAYEIPKGENKSLKVVFAKEFTNGKYTLQEYHIYNPSSEAITVLPSEISVFEGAKKPLAVMLTAETFKGWAKGFVIERGGK